MLKKTLLFAILCGTFAFSQIETTQEPAPALNWAFPLLVGQAQNILVWQYNLNIDNKTWARISLNSMKSNIKNGFEWDDNHFGINFFGHPYQGSYYYTSARSFGYSFYPSLLYATAGSFTWEMLMETEKPSTNDLMLTSMGGAIYGEILYRLSELFLAKPEPRIVDEASALVLHPMSYTQHKIVGVRKNNPGYNPVDFSLGLGGGRRFNGNYNYDSEFYDKPNVESLRGGLAAIDLSLTYGKPNRTIKEPFEYFSVDALYHYGRVGGPFFVMNTLGKLKNKTFNSVPHWVDVGIYTHFDTYYGRLVELNAISLGLGLDFNLQGNYFRFRTTNLPAFVLIGATDFNYDEIFAAKYEEVIEQRSYQYNYGFQYKMNTEIEWLNKGILKNNTSAYLFRAIPSSELHYGTNGIDIVLSNAAILEAYLPWNLRIGTRFDSYIKIATYDSKDFSLMSRMVSSLTGYLAYCL